MPAHVTRRHANAQTNANVRNVIVNQPLHLMLWVVVPANTLRANNVARSRAI